MGDIIPSTTGFHNNKIAKKGTEKLMNQRYMDVRDMYNHL